MGTGDTKLLGEDAVMGFKVENPPAPPILPGSYPRTGVGDTEAENDDDAKDPLLIDDMPPKGEDRTPVFDELFPLKLVENEEVDP